MTADSQRDWVRNHFGQKRFVPQHEIKVWGCSKLKKLNTSFSLPTGHADGEPVQVCSPRAIIFVGKFILNGILISKYIYFDQ